MERITGEAGIPNGLSAERAARMLAASADASGGPVRAARFVEVSGSVPPRDTLAGAAAGLLPDGESFALLAEAGIPVARHALVDSADAALAFARAGDGPIVLKRTGVAHKTEADALRLSLTGDEGIRQAFTDLGGGPGAPLLAQEMVGGGIELLLGGSGTRASEPMVAVGVGGVMTEVLADVTWGAAPLDGATAAQMVRRLRSQALLEGFRGFPPVDVDAVAGAVVALARILAEHPRIAEVDINPIIAKDATCRRWMPSSASLRRTHEPDRARLPATAPRRGAEDRAVHRLRPPAQARARTWLRWTIGSSACTTAPSTPATVSMPCPRMNPLELAPDARADAPIGTVIAAYKSGALRDEDRKGVQNGGAITALLAWAVDAGKVTGALVAGGTMLEPEAKVARTGDEVRAAAGTKYGMVPLLSALHRLEDTGSMATVAPSLPGPGHGSDRVEGRAQPGSAPGGGGHVVHLGPGRPGVAPGIRKISGNREVTRLDVTPPPDAVLEIGFDKGEAHGMPLPEARKMIREACKTCDDMTAEASDIAIGTFEADPRYNLVLVRTERGRALWQSAVDAGVVSAELIAPSQLAGLEGASLGKRKRARDNARAMYAEGLHVPYFAEASDV